MQPTFDKVHLKFKLNGNYYSHEDLKEVAYSLVKEGENYEKQLGNFLLDWLDNKDYIEVKTSGSTGEPKVIRHSKQAMVNSAIATGDFFNLNPRDKALSCLPCSFIAGKMMVVRAIMLGLELDVITPSLTPYFNPRKVYDFCAMIPLQMQNSLDRIDNIKVLLVGGASVNDSLIEKIQDSKSHVYESFGMTETVTHFALRKLNHTNGNTPNFKTLPKVTVSVDDRNCLVVHVPYIQDEPIITNDVVNLISDTGFQWLGRYDNIINSAGLKIHPEQLEAKLNNKLTQRFIITSEADEVYQDKIVLLVEGEETNIKDSVFSELESYEKPKHIYFIPSFTETKTGKIHRKKTLYSFKNESSLSE